MVQLLHPYVTPGKKCTFGGAFVYVLLIHLLIIKYLLTAYYPGDAAEDGIMASQAWRSISPSEQSGDSCMCNSKHTGLGSIQVAIPSWGLLARLQGEFNDLGKSLC